MEGIEVDRFVQSLEHEYANLRLVMDKEPLIDRALLLLCMATAVNCMDWNEPKKTLDACKDSVKSVTEFAVSLIDRWAPEGRFVFYGDIELEQDEWNKQFMDSQAIADELLRAHLESFGSDTDEKILHAYNETIFCLTYMISAGCARCLKPDDAVAYCVKNLDHVFDFIEKNCKRVEVKG